MAEIKNKLEASEALFIEYKDKNSIFSIEGKQKIISRKIDEFNDAYIEAKNKRLELESKLRKLSKIRKKPVSEENSLYFRSLIDNPLIDHLYNQLLDLEIEISRAGKIYKQKHPKVIQIQTDIENTRKKIGEEISKELRNMETAHAVLESKEKVMLQTMADFEKESRTLNKMELNYTIHKRNVETNQELYDTLRSKIEKEDATGNIDVSNIRISQDAQTSLNPVWPNRKAILFLAFAFGLTASFGFVLLAEYFNKSAHTDADVSRFFGLPTLSTIPRFGNKMPKNSGEHLTKAYVNSPSYWEPYRRLRANIGFALDQKPNRILLIGSAGGKEGKTFTLINLAHALERTGKSVLMIDGNLRHPDLTRHFASSEDSGLAELIQRVPSISVVGDNPGFRDTDSHIIKLTPFLHLLPAGKNVVPDLLDSEKVSVLLSDFKEKFEFVIIDTPAILSSADSVVLASRSDGVILVIRAGLAKREIVKDALEKLRLAKAHVLGVVINGAKT